MIDELAFTTIAIEDISLLSNTERLAYKKLEKLLQEVES